MQQVGPALATVSDQVRARRLRQVLLDARMKTLAGAHPFEPVGDPGVRSRHMESMFSMCSRLT